ncbi:3-hydroxyacyl-CoA dehydrogenase NAD-binding domain-containing protein [Tistrella mobilis]|uniref:3-hydroxyacyl-CoA dehydrogenase NAD-binding domain-containing protein n=1 Tax=Tistrella mobilis TaxID=171437 RepID=UPI000C0A2C64|nr:3-hydroxyacyl-CoA dehydrogenase [Tistrella sp.]
MTMFDRIAVLGAGTIGMSWAALFAASGREVVVYDPAPDTEARCRRLVAASADALSALGQPQAGDDSRMRFTTDPAEAVDGAGFVQESVPERVEVKHALYARIADRLAPQAIIGSSTSGLTLGQLQAGCAVPGRLIIAHPFNPPHLIPLVELMGNDLTDADVIDTADAFYTGLGKVCVRLHKEVPGHIANRLQAAIWREAIHLAAEGVASVEDIDKAVAYGPGLRWAAMGPVSLFHLGGGPGGIRAFCDHLGGAFQSWWQDLGTPMMTPEVVDMLAEGVAAGGDARPIDELAAERDRLILAYLLARGSRTTPSS